MALLSRIKSPDWQDGDDLTAADLKAEFNNIVNGLNGLADISVLTVTTSGNAIIGGNATIAGNAAITGTLSASTISTAQKELGRIDNLALVLSAGVLSLTDASGASLSANNAGYVVVPSTTAGLAVSLKVSSSVTIKDGAHASPDMTNLEWGITASANYAQDMPFFLYVVNRGNNPLDGTDGNSAIFIARSPKLSVTPASSNSIGDTDNIAVTDDQDAIILFGAYTEANYTSKPCQLIGAIRMQYDTATHNWTIQSFGNTDGLGRGQLAKTFAQEWSFPVSQMGGVTNYHFNNSAGSGNPTWATAANITYKWRLHVDGSFDIEYSTDAAGNCTNGSNANRMRLSLPIVPRYVNTWYAQAGFGALGATPDSAIVHGAHTGNGNRYLDLYQTATLADIAANSFGNAVDDLYISIKNIPGF